MLFRSLAAEAEAQDTEEQITDTRSVRTHFDINELKETLQILVNKFSVERKMLALSQTAQETRNKHVLALQAQLEQRESQISTLRWDVRACEQTIADLQKDKRLMEDEQRDTIIALAKFSQAVEKERVKSRPSFPLLSLLSLQDMSEI